MRQTQPWLFSLAVLLVCCFLVKVNSFSRSTSYMRSLRTVASRRVAATFTARERSTRTYLPLRPQWILHRPQDRSQVRPLSAVPDAALQFQALNDTEEDLLISSTNNLLKDDKTISHDDAAPPSSSLEKAPAEVSDKTDEEDVFKGLTSRPKGNWNPKDPLEWCRDFGGRSEEIKQHLAPLIHLKPGDEGYFDVSSCQVPGVTQVRSVQDARRVLNQLRQAPPETIFACDTEVMEIDLKTVGPVGNGYVTCLSIYGGPTLQLGAGEPGNALWIDNLDDACGVLQEFKDWLEDESVKKVWHNYGFDRHVLWNEGIDCLGFAGDTMHMARLQDTSRLKGGAGGYSLEALTDSILGRRKKPMKEIFGVARLRKDGTPGSLIDIPPVEVLQRDPKFRSKWIMYSCYDSEGTWLLRKKLQELLEEMPWLRQKNLYDYYVMHMRKFGEVLTDMERRGIRVDAKDYLANVEVQAREDRAFHLKKFRQWAQTQIGADGLALNPASSVQLCTFFFGGAVNSKTQEPTETVRVFKVPREEIPDDAMEAYLRQREQQQSEGVAPDEPKKDKFDGMKAKDLKKLCKEYGLKQSGKKSELQNRLRQHFLEPPQDDYAAMSEDDLRDACIARGLSKTGKRKQLLNRLREDSDYTCQLLAASSPKDSDGYKKISEALERAAKSGGGVLREILAEMNEKAQAEPKYVDVTIQSIGMVPEKYTAGGAASVTADVLRKLAGDPSEEIYGTAYEFFGGGDAGREACEAIDSLCSIGSIDTMIASFITSLQSLADSQSRVHCSLNLNTETGRLSSRRPNLQNQPALEKDKYKIRQAFQASPGNNLIVADYGQLELRLLASMTSCTSMIKAFAAGGDFHSRTALDMFDYVKEKVNEGECLLEWDYADGDPPKPLLKDMFASERRHAKTLNFSIAYGKTAHGLSQDWGVTRQKAENMLQAWYKARPEVLKWQKDTKEFARRFGITRTLMGRYRQLPEALSNNRKLIGHAERASINTPIQGGAADVAMMAMNKINDSEKLKRLGWILLMQIHDEVILEGPEECAEEAFEEVTTLMQNPFVFGLEPTKVPLLVDGSCTHKTWYEAK